MFEVFYIAECNITKRSAYTQHVMQMCDSFAKKNLTNLITPSVYDNKINKDLMIENKINFLSFNFFSKLKNLNFLSRIVFSLKVSMSLKKNPSKKLILTRSLMSSIFLTLFGFKHYLEIHSELKGLTKFLMINLNFLNSKNIIKVIFISRELSNLFKLKKEKILILHDAVNLKHFKFYNNKNNKKIKKIFYIGNFYKGRGIECIMKVAKYLPQYDFTLIGSHQERNFRILKSSNLNIIKFTEYRKIAKIIQSADLLLMLYEKEVFVNSKNLNTANYCSPLKMFEYLACKKFILSTKQNGISEILQNNKNAYMINNLNYVEVIKNILKIDKNFNRNKKMKYFSYQTAKKYTWDNRVNLIKKDYLKYD